MIQLCASPLSNNKKKETNICQKRSIQVDEQKKTTSDVNGRIFSIIESMGSIFEYIYKKITF